MALTINPVVNGVAIGTFVRHAALFVAGAAAGASTTAIVVWAAVQGALDIAPAPLVAAVAGGVVAVCILRDAGAPVPTPYIAKQVPEWLRRIVPLGFTAVVYGWLLGLGFVTRYTFAAHSAVVVGAAFVSLEFAIAMSLVLALGKGLVFLAAPKRVSKEAFTAAFDRRFYFRRRGVYALRAANAAVAAAVLSVLAISIGG
jgi:hypothetical protein